ncbi:MAG: Hsp20/alpha crystallin family protein [bacterium]|nr:Hsp20/alpha crystallin family protein [bacterium]
MNWKRIAPWNWFQDEGKGTLANRTPEYPDNPSDPFSLIRSELSRVFGEAFTRPFPLASQAAAFGGALDPALRPSVDISEGKKAYNVKAELPGVDKEDVTIEAEGQTLVIKAEKRQEKEEDEEGYHCIERSYGSLQRVLSLPDDADVEAIEARYRNGVLKLHIPKHPARVSNATTIEIQGD